MLHVLTTWKPKIQAQGKNRNEKEENLQEICSQNKCLLNCQKKNSKSQSIKNLTLKFSQRKENHCKNKNNQYTILVPEDL